jgi:hypothetical protein
MICNILSVYLFIAPTVYDCNFEQGFCKWTQVVTGDQFNWTRAQGPTGSALTGPTNDHTTGKRKSHLVEAESYNSILEMCIVILKY